MTVSTTLDQQYFDADGVNANFPFNFRFLENEDIFVWVIAPDGTESLQMMTTNYTLSGRYDPGGGTVTMSVPPPLTVPATRVLVRRIVPQTQPTSIRNQGKFFPEVHENVFDRLTMLIQQALSGNDRSLHKNISGTGWNFEGLRGVNVGDPISPQDAATMSWAQQYIGGILLTGQGPINNAANVVYVFPNGVPRFVQDLSSRTDPVKGAAGIGYRGRDVGQKLAQAIDVKDYGAIGDGSSHPLSERFASLALAQVVYPHAVALTDEIDWCAIVSAVTYAKTRPTVSVGPSYLVPPIWFPHGTYMVNRSIRFDEAHQLDGDNARIVATITFAGVVVSLHAGGTAVCKYMFIFLKGRKGAVVSADEPGRWGAKVGAGITLDCQDYADGGIYTERMLYSHFNCEVQFAAHDGIQVGPSSWGLNLDNIVVENFSDFGVHFLLNSAANGASMKNPRIWGEFKEGQAGVLFDASAEVNGFAVSGGFIEKVRYGVIIAGGNGPMDWTGVDFEQCRYNVFRVASEPFGQKIGPITVNACFLHSIELPKVYCDYGTVLVKGCRMFPGTVDFETEGLGRGVIVASENRYMAGDVMGIGAGVALTYEENNGLTKQQWNYLSHKVSSFLPAYDLRNHQFRDAPHLQSSGFNFYTNYQGGVQGQYVSRSDWWCSEYQHLASPGVLTRVVGVRLANDSGQNSFQPMADAITSLGGPGARWTTVYASTGTINTSDARAKQQIKSLSDKELAVAQKLKSLIKTFKFNDAVEQKAGEARVHVGVIAQDVKKAFEDEGLIAENYALLCYDEWDEAWEDVPEKFEYELTTEDQRITDGEGRPLFMFDGAPAIRPAGTPKLDEKGEPIKHVVAPATKRKITDAGNRYGVRYDQLLAFIIAAM